MKKLISLLCLFSLLMGILSLAALPTVALSANGGDVLFSNVLLNVGTDESERRITWYSNREGFGEVHYAKASDGTDGEFPTSYQTSKASVHITSTDDTSYKASLTGSFARRKHSSSPQSPIALSQGPRISIWH